MLTLGQKTILRKAIRPFGAFYREVRDSYESMSEDVRKIKQEALNTLEEQMTEVFDGLRKHMSDDEIAEWGKTIQDECNKRDRQYDLYRDDDFGDGFRPVKKEEGATAYDERPVYPQEARKVNPEAVGCFGKQIESAFSQKELGLGE